MSKVALVTGGNRGIGRGITEALLREGWRVSIMATRPAPSDVLADLATLGEVRYTQGSVADLGDHARYVEETLADWGRIDALVNNAGVAPSQRDDLLDATPDSYDRVMAINLRGPYFLTQKVANVMIAQGPPAEGEITGTIVNVSSISADTVSTNRGEYCLSKAGVGMATQLWAVRLAPEGILVYEVRPGVIATDMTAGVTEKYDAFFASGAVPMPRWGRPSDVGGAVAQLTAGRMPYSTGDVITVGGGMQIKTL
ncbi:3-ketoacyl-ACP reductase [Propioniciclava flava]|uniref:3-ketoacyl-ACP reductase n=1 Tax=Propioniciclava flava TaxID=2072026 RepID=A0A4Q2EDK2_9ACTN|nr:3-ketoacyl-ACP reductase [Propioniciclava flava]RXW31239.1 3-ketoacyl-ACP reductase [Propioniciclava flava]